jgi:flotillin
VNQAIQAGGESYFRYRQIEMLPQMAPVIAEALSTAKMVTISGGGGAGAAETTTNNIASVIQTVLAAQLVTRGGILDSANDAPARNDPPSAPAGAQSPAPKTR